MNDVVAISFLYNIIKQLFFLGKREELEGGAVF